MGNNEKVFLVVIHELMDGQNALEITARESFENASMVLYQVMASAIANANVKQTTCSIMTIDGYTIKTETFKRSEANAE